MRICWDSNRDYISRSILVRRNNLSSLHRLWSHVIMDMPAHHHVNVILIEEGHPCFLNVEIRFFPVVRREMKHCKFPTGGCFGELFFNPWRLNVHRRGGVDHQEPVSYT